MFLYIRERSVCLSTFVRSRDLFDSLGERMEPSSIQWMSKSYKKYRWLVGLRGITGGFCIAQCLQTILVSYYSLHKSSRLIYRFVQEISFDRFICKEIIGRDFYLKTLGPIYGVDPSSLNLKKVCAFQAKLIVRILLLADNTGLTGQFMRHILQVIEKMIRILFKQRRIKMKKYRESNAAYKMIFAGRYRIFSALSKNIQEDDSCTISTLFRFCLQILSPLIDHSKNYEFFDLETILRHKRFIQSELLVLKDENLIMEFQLINWPKELATHSTTRVEMKTSRTN